MGEVVEMYVNSNPGKSRFKPREMCIEPLELRRLLTFYTVMDLGTLGGPSSFAYDINSNNQVVGYAKLASGADRAFLFKDANNNGVADSGEMVNLGTLPGFAASYAYAINNNGIIVGSALTAANSSKAVKFQSPGNPSDLGMGFGSIAYDINTSGEVVGAVLLGISYTAAYRSPTGTVSRLGTLSSDGAARSEAHGINDSGTIAGYSNTDSGDSAFILPAGGAMTAIGFLNQPVFYQYGYAWGINGWGQIVGEGFNSDAQYHAFRYENGDVIDLGTPSGFTTSQGLAINNLGQVVGQGKDGAGIGRAILYTDGAMFDLNSLIPANSGWTLTKARSINDNGYIVGEGISPSGQTHAFLLTPATNVLTINGDQDFAGEDDTIILRRSSSDPTRVEVFLNNSTSTANSSFVASDYVHVFLNGGGGNDQIVLDFSGGLPFPVGGASIDGQEGDLDLLKLVGTSSADNIAVGAGRISLGTAVMNFAGIEGMQIDSAGGDDAVNLTAALPFMPEISAGTGNDSITISAGTYSLNSDAGAGSVEKINVQNGAVLNLLTSQHLSRLSIGGTAKVNLEPDGSHFIRVNDLSVASTAALDVFDNDLIIDTTAPDVTLNIVNGLIALARNGATRWGSIGITSTAAAAESITTLAALINNNGTGAPIRGTLSGETLNTDMVLVLYANEGDLDVNGTIDADDYALIDSGYAQKLPGYHWGDINYSGGAPNADDFFLIDRAYSSRPTGLSGQAMSALSEELDQPPRHLHRMPLPKKVPRSIGSRRRLAWRNPWERQYGDAR